MALPGAILCTSLAYHRSIQNTFEPYDHSVQSIACLLALKHGDTGLEKASYATASFSQHPQALEHIIPFINLQNIKVFSALHDHFIN